jgi:hypothetical protein
MIDENINIKRIRDHAPYRKSMSLTEEDIQRLSYLEKLFSSQYPLDVPFSFSKTVSKCIEIAFTQSLLRERELGQKYAQKALDGKAAHPELIQKRQINKQVGQLIGNPSKKLRKFKK